MRTRSIAIPLLLATASLAGAQQPVAPEPIESAADQAVDPPLNIDSETNEYDLRAGVMRFRDNVTITRGPMYVEADEGIVRQEGDQITAVELTGDPTTWRDTLEDGSVVRGQARRIHFDVVDNVVTLTGSARLTHEQGEFTGDELVYDLDTERLAGRGAEGNRVRVVIESDAIDRGTDGTDSAASGDGETTASDDDSPEPPADEADGESEPEADPDDPEDPPADS
ncbi:MAG: lipopolysaccharide transport periplasmic protein LptA [Candidatus Wenzhouxiangella sp. M2_3B_020]